MIQVTNTDGTMFNVKVILNLEAYGLNDCLIHDNTDPMIEFYDSRYTHCGPDGQFVSRYYLSTLEEYHSLSADLNLYGGESEWWITADNVQEAVTYARKRLSESTETNESSESSELGGSDLTLFPSDIEELCETLDASIFSGDLLEYPKNIARLEWYLRRWTKQLESSRRITELFSDGED